MIVQDFGLGLLSKIFVNSWEVENIEIKYIQPGKPSQNGNVERFKSNYREDKPDAHIFRDLEEVALSTEQWRPDYNRDHTHRSLGRISPTDVFEEFSKGLAPLNDQFV